MPLSRQDCVELIGQLQSELRGIDQELQARATEHVEDRDDPRRYLLDYLDILARLISERSRGSHGRVLNLLNRSIRTENGGPIRSLRLMLPPIQQELQQREYLDLATLPDHSQVIEELQALRDAIALDFERGSNEPR